MNCSECIAIYHHKHSITLLLISTSYYYEVRNLVFVYVSANYLDFLWRV